MAAGCSDKARKGGRTARLNTVKTARSPANFGADPKIPNYTLSASPDRVCVIACGALAHEILDIIQLNDLGHIALTCLPAQLHNTPEAIVPAMDRAIKEARQAGFAHIFCGYADCGTGGLLDQLLQRENIPRLPGAHCYAFFSGVDHFESRADNDMRAFFLTDFLARHFDSLTWEPLGLNNHPELLDSYFGHYEKIIYLSQKDDQNLLQRAREIAGRLQLDFEHRKTGYGDLASSLLHIKP